MFQNKVLRIVRENKTIELKSNQDECYFHFLNKKIWTAS